MVKLWNKWKLICCNKQRNEKNKHRSKINEEREDFNTFICIIKINYFFI